MKKRWMSCLLALGMAASAGFTACGGNGDNGDVAGITTIRVGTYNGGLGLDWLRDAAERFEDIIADLSIFPCTYYRFNDFICKKI